MLFADAYNGRRVLVTGHTGFKGSWLARWLTRQGAVLTGYALDPPSAPDHYSLLPRDYASLRGDVRDAAALAAALAQADPEIVFHLAAQPLVRRSYQEPLQTLDANVMGVANLLEACRRALRLKAVVVVTSDKCYENREWAHGYRETDPLGGHDLYSASKACAEIVTAAYRRSFFAGDPPRVLVASVRAGNVLGGGDWAEDRLAPDLVRAAAGGRSALVRNPGSVRPWQHVLDVLCGYLQLGQRLLEGRVEFADCWNFGPGVAGVLTAGEVAQRMSRAWNAVAFHFPEGSGREPHEAGLLALDSAKARRRLGWRPLCDVDECLERTASWYRAYYERGEVLTDAQIDAYEAAAREAGLAWAGGAA